MKAKIKSLALAAALGFGLASAASAATVTPTGSDSVDVSLSTSEVANAIYTTTISSPISLSFDIDLQGMTNVFAVVVGSESDGGLFFVAEFLASKTYSYVLEAGNYAVSLLNLGQSGTFAVSNIKITELSSVPVPASLPLLAGALGMVGLMKRRRKAA